MRDNIKNRIFLKIEIIFQIINYVFLNNDQRQTGLRLLILKCINSNNQHHMFNPLEVYDMF